jgi:hypothetical protein
MAAAVAALQRRVEDASCWDVRWFGDSIRASIVGVVALPVVTVTMYLLVGFAASRLGVRTTDRVFWSTATPGITVLVLRTLLVFLVAPVVEELFWRGYIQGCLQRSFNTRLAVFTQAVVFALVHFRGPVGSLKLISLGLVLGVWRCRKHTLMPLILAHMLLNGLTCFPMWSDHMELRALRSTEDYRVSLETLCTPGGCAPSDNARQDYERAFALLQDRPSGLEGADLKVWPANLTAEKITLLRDWVSSNQDAIAQFGEAVQKPYYCADYRSMLIGDFVPPTLGDYREICLLVLARAQMSAMDGDPLRCIADLCMCYRSAKHLSGPKTLIEQLVGIAVEGQTTNVALSMLKHAWLDTMHLVALHDRMEQTWDKQRSPIDFSGERLIFHMMVRTNSTEGVSGQGRVPQSPANPSPSSVSRGQASPEPWRRLPLLETVRVANEVFAFLNSIQERTPIDLRREGIDPRDTLLRMVDDNALLGELIPGYARAYELAHRRRALRDALPVVIATKRYQLERGELPDALDQLVLEGYLAALPTDPYGGEPYVYRRVDDRFWLYSLGADFDDDGGVRGRKAEEEWTGDDIFWPPKN